MGWIFWKCSGQVSSNHQICTPDPAYPHDVDRGARHLHNTAAEHRNTMATHKILMPWTVVAPLMLLGVVVIDLIMDEARCCTRHASCLLCHDDAPWCVCVCVCVCCGGFCVWDTQGPASMAQVYYTRQRTAKGPIALVIPVVVVLGFVPLLVNVLRGAAPLDLISTVVSVPLAYVFVGMLVRSSME